RSVNCTPRANRSRPAYGAMPGMPHRAEAPDSGLQSLAPGFEARAAIVRAGLSRAISAPARFKPSLLTSMMFHVDSEGDVAHQADLARTTYGINGSGVKIGVMSDGVDSLAALQGAGDLPSVTVLSGQAGARRRQSGPPRT